MWFTVCVNRKRRILYEFYKTKKVVAAGLSALMMMTSTTSVFAAESGDKSANLNYQVSSSYDWIIHSSIDFGADAGVGKTVDRTANQVKVLKNVIPEGKYLNISVKGSGANDAFTVDNGGSEVLNYDVSDDNGAVGVNGNVLSVPAGTNTATQNMGFKLIQLRNLLRLLDSMMDVLSTMQMWVIRMVERLLVVQQAVELVAQVAVKAQEELLRLHQNLKR